jgi:hypothetical protein
MFDEKYFAKYGNVCDINYRISKQIHISFLFKYINYFDDGCDGTHIFDKVKAVSLPINVIYHGKGKKYFIKIDFLDLFADMIYNEHIAKFFCSKYCVRDLYDASYIISRLVPENYYKLFFMIKTAYLLGKKYKTVPYGFLSYVSNFLSVFVIGDLIKFFEVFLFRLCKKGYSIEIDDLNCSFKYVAEEEKIGLHTFGIDFLPADGDAIEQSINKYNEVGYLNLELNVKVLCNMVVVREEFVKSELLALIRKYIICDRFYEKFYEFISV